MTDQFTQKLIEYRNFLECIERQSKSVKERHAYALAKDEFYRLFPDIKPQEDSINIGGFVLVKEASKRLLCSSTTIRRYVDKGHLEAVRHPVNRYRYISEDSIRKFEKKLGIT